MKARCLVYSQPALRFTPGHCDHFIHLGLKEDCYPFGIVVSGVEWGWFLKRFAGEWKVLPECGYHVEEETVRRILQEGKARQILEDSRHIYPRTPVLARASLPLPVLIPRHLWKGRCQRCGTCCSVPRRSTGKPCEYLRFEGRPAPPDPRAQ